VSGASQGARYASALPPSIIALADALPRKTQFLAGRLPPETAARLGRLLQITNTYYSNLIEGQYTEPADMQKAQAAPVKDRKRLKSLAVEQMAVQAITMHRTLVQLTVCCDISRQASAGRQTRVVRLFLRLPTIIASHGFTPLQTEMVELPG